MSTQELYEFHLQRAKELADKIADEGADTTLSSLWRYHVMEAITHANRSGKPQFTLA